MIDVSRNPSRASSLRSWHGRRPVNNNEIIERALYTSEITGKDVIVAAGDFSMLYQASSAGLKTALVDRLDRTPRLERPSDN